VPIEEEEEEDDGRMERQTDTHYEAKAHFAIYANALKMCTRKRVTILCEFVVPDKM
jgi:hypothetical protein